MDDHQIVGVHVMNRTANSVEVQKIFSEFGCSIRTRVGLHDADDTQCSTSGMVILDMIGDRERVDEMVSRLEAIDGVQARKMIFTHS